MDFIYWGLVGVGVIFFLSSVSNLIKVAYYSRKNEKTICPTCENEILKMGKKFNCYSCKNKIVIDENGEAIKG